MDLEIFEHIGEILDAYEDKKDVYKLIAEEVKEFFQNTALTGSDCEFNVVYRIKTAESIREKLIRNNYAVKSGKSEELLAGFQDILGFRIECKFVDEESYAYDFLKERFDATDDHIFYYMPSMPKIRLRLSSEQPQKQKNGFSIYKIDGLYMLGQDSMRFELQIKALVNVFWGEIEHRVVYKNNDYLLADTFVSDLLTSIKQSLNMIDGQLYVLYRRFKGERALSNGEAEAAKARSIEGFIINMVYDTFHAMMLEQMGFDVDFKASCEAIVRYILDINKAENMEDYGRVMLYIFDALNNIQKYVRLDEQVEFERKLYYEDVFSGNLLETVQKLANINYRWHVHFSILFSLERGKKADALENYVRYFKDTVLGVRAFTLLEGAGIKNASRIRMDILNTVSEAIRQKKQLEFFCAQGILVISEAIGALVPVIIGELSQGMEWIEIKDTCLNKLKDRLCEKFE